MNRKPSPRDLTRLEYRTFISTSTIAGLLVWALLLINVHIEILPQEMKHRLTYLTLGATFYIILYTSFLAVLRDRRDSIMWVNAIISGFGLMAVGLSLPSDFIAYYRILVLLTVVSVSILSERPPMLLVILIGAGVPSVVWLWHAQSLHQIAEYAGVPIAAILVGETLLRVQNVARQQIHRLETINSFSRQLASTSLNRTEIFSLLNTAIPKAVLADSYYVAIQEGDEVYVPLFFDDGEYFNGGRVKMEGTLSGWVIKNNRELFLPDLREPLDLPGINVVVAGQDKVSLSWIGVPSGTISALVCL